MVEFFWNCSDPEDIYEPPYCYPDDYFTIEYDYGYSNPNRNICGAAPADIFIQFTDLIAGHPRIQYQWRTCACAHNTPYQDVPQDRKLYERVRGCDGQSWPKDISPMGKFKYNNGRTPQAPNPYTVIPIDPRHYASPVFFPQAYGGDQNHFFPGTSIGRIIMNLTIEKTLTTPIEPWDYVYPTFPGITIENEATMLLTKGTSNQERKITFRKFTDYTANTHLEIYPYSKLELQASSNPAERAHIYFESYANTVIWQYGQLVMRENSNIDLLGNSFMKFKGNSIVAQYPGSIINIRNNAKLLNCGANFTVTTQSLIAIFDNGQYLISNVCPEDLTDAFESEIDSGGAIELYDNGNITIESNCKLVFSGANSYLKADPGTNIILGEGASIEFRNGAYLEADGCTFTSMNPNEIWSGIVMDGAGSESYIQNCTFENASTSLNITNTICNIYHNTINVPVSVSGATGIEATNESNITILENTIELGTNTTARGIYFFNYDGDGMPGGGGGSSSYSLNIINNFINGGAYPITIDCLTSSQLPFLIKANQITPSSAISSYGIFAYNITGDIKLNNFVNISSSNALTLQQCNVNMFENFLQSGNTSVNLQSFTTAQSAPIQNEYGQWVWYGGKNGVTSDQSDCMDFGYGSNPIVSPKGTNCFTVNTQPNYHISGEYCMGFSYLVTDNYWSQIPPSFNVNCGLQQVTVNYTPYYTECPASIGDIVGTQIDDIGGGLYDTVYITAGGGEGGSYTTKAIVTGNTLYSQAITKRKQGDFAGAINKCKELINGYDTSKYFLSSLSELYRNYLESDTIRNQNITTGLFNNLRTYLEQKIGQYSGNTQFVEKAYKYLLMCMVKTRNFPEAIAGYENIMNNHPDPVTRLNASWDRSAVVMLMGQGGGENQLGITNSKLRIKRLLDKNPVHKTARNVFKNVASELRSDFDTESDRSKYTKEERSELKRRIEKFNPTSLAEFKDKLASDIKLINVINAAKRTGDEKGVNTPLRYTLYQNYPNPFNPVTLIKYDIPKDAFVTIRVFDILGKEVFKAEEFKKSGSYELKFDGKNLATGLYFYTLETNGFKDTKKMVLLK